jgi:hypothetical protein
MDPRFIDDLRREAYALSQEAVPFLEKQISARDRKSVAGLRRTAAQTRLTTLLMDAVAWLALLDPKDPQQRSMRLAARVAAGEAPDPAVHEPDLADLTQRVFDFHRRLEHIEARLESGISPPSQEGAPLLAPVPALSDIAPART